MVPSSNLDVLKRFSRRKTFFFVDHTGHLSGFQTKLIFHKFILVYHSEIIMIYRKITVSSDIKFF